MPPELLAQFPIAEDAIEALGIVLLADGRVRGGRRDRRRCAMVRRRSPASNGSSSARPTRTSPSSSRATASSSSTGGAGSPTTRRASGPSGAFGRRRIPDWLALVGDAADGYPGLPGWGAKSAAAVLPRYDPRGHPGEGLAMGRPEPPRCRRPRRHVARAVGRRTPLSLPGPAPDHGRRRGHPPGGSG